jgi:gliding motility-associated-like protein
MAEFTFRQDSCKVDSVFFTNQSSPNRYNDPITGYQWSFGDGRSSTLTNPGHLYAAAGTYTVKLITTDIHGCTDTAAHIVNWYPAPVINFDLINGDACAPFTVDAATIITPLLPNNYTTFWDFGDGTTSTQNYPVHIYNNDGTYKIRLSVISPNGCRGADSTVVSVHGRPVANFTFGSDTCVLGPIPFQSTSFSANDTIVRYTWDFGDNITSIAKNPIYQYMSPGAYTVILRVVDSYGCRDSIQKSLSWYPAPNLKINMDKREGCSPQTVQFRYNAGTFNLASYSKLWDFGDGTTSQDSTPVHLYPNPGLYYVRFSVTSPQSGCSSSVLDSIRIFASPTANFTASYQACELSAVSFTDGSTVGDVPITSWKWSFGDGGTSAQPSPQHVYNDTAVYNVRLIVRDQKGCSDTITKDVPWLPKPVFPVRLYDKRGCVSYTTDFEARGYPIDGYKTYWFFGDGQGSADPKPSHTFDQIGTYPLRLVITSPMGCTDTFYAQTIVSPKPTAQFSYSPHELSNLNPTVQFTDLSSNSGAWEWDFGTGSRSSIRNPKYVYPDTGKFQVNLIITDQNGCRDTASKIVDIIPKFTYYLPNAFSPNNDGINDGFRGTGIMDKINAFEMTIWNRWGEMVFQTNNPTDEWNGRKNNTGVLSPAGVYVVVVKLKGGRGEVQELKGYATLVH